jgi:pimeloyl-ACP methyl ester carboxylesterase
MVYWTTKRQLADDVVAAIKYVQHLEREKQRDKDGAEMVEVVLVGHSSGGGLSQIMLSAGDVKVKGLVLVGSIPCFGS